MYRSPHTQCEAHTSSRSASDIVDSGFVEPSCRSLCTICDKSWPKFLGEYSWLGLGLHHPPVAGR